MAKRPSRSPKSATTTKAIPPAAPDEIDDGTFTVRMKGGALDGQSVTIDVFTAKVAIEAVEIKHNSAKDGWRVSAPFLTDLAAALDAIGVKGCSGTAAYQIWLLVAKRFEDLKKNMHALQP
jgi:hypothetical protein